MIGFDTNLLVRIFAQDDPVQASRVARLLEHELEQDKAFLDAIVLVEFAWTMRRVYRWERDWVLTALEKLSDHPNIEIEDRDTFRDAIAQCRNLRVDFPDAYLGMRNMSRGCSTTLTFDQDASSMQYFTELKA
jgi:predicted nucleic-acid-binding protein